MDNLDLAGSVPVGASLELTYKGTLNGTPDQPLMTTLQTKMATNQWRLSASSFAPTYTVEGWRNGWVVFHADSVTPGNLG